MAESDKLVISELLCFLTNKCHFVMFDKLVKIAVDFFTWDEISSAKSILMCAVRENNVDAEQRLPKRKAHDKERNTIADMLKSLMDPEVKHPVYVIKNLSRVPPIGFEDVDAVTVCNELACIKSRLNELLAWKSEMEIVAKVNEGKATRKEACDVADNAVLRVDLPPLQQLREHAGTSVTKGKTFSDVASADKDEWRSVKGREKKKQPMKVGSSSSSVLRVAAPRSRPLEVFVSRFAEDTTEGEVKIAVEQLLAEPAGYAVVECVKLKPKYAGYASFRVTVEGTREVVAAAEEVLLCPSSWKEGVIFRKYFVHRAAGVVVKP
jgi:hypothetical protein